MIDKITWFFATAGVFDVIGPLLLPIILAVGLYQSHYPFAVMRALWRVVIGERYQPLRPEERAPIVVVIPSLLRHQKELDAVIMSVRSALASEYPGDMMISVAIDGCGGESAALFARLEQWVSEQAAPANVRVAVTGTLARQGKAMAVDHGLRVILDAVDSGEIDLARPTVFFNMDADCELAPRALQRMVRELLRVSRWSGERGMIVTSNVFVAPEHAWGGWRRFFSVQGQLALLVAREYREALGLGRYNDFRLIPQLGASGALYCTWTSIADDAPYFARFVQQLRWRDWAMWWLGAPPPRFDRSKLVPLPEALTGMGDDTWMSFLACAARWTSGRVDLQLPRTPLHGLWYALRSYFFRPFRYDPHAKIQTESPTTMRVLFKQRVRWNISRIWTVQKWRVALFYHLQLGLPAIADVALSTAFQSIVVVGFLMMPFAERPPPMWLSFAIVVELFYVGTRIFSTFVSLAIDRSLWKNRHLFLVLPMAGTFHFVFNIATTIAGFWSQIFGWGLDDGFAPMQTHVRGGVGRVALLYRVTRAMQLAVRSVVRGDVPLGWFWLGWDETRWTRNGYESLQGQGVPILKEPIVPARVDPVIVPAAVEVREGVAIVLDAISDTDADDAIPDSGIRRRPGSSPPPAHAVGERRSVA